MPFVEDARIQMFYNRVKRGTMPSVKFVAPNIERDAEYWNNKAQDHLQQKLQKNQFNQNIAKNLILFLGDGMSRV